MDLNLATDMYQRYLKAEQEILEGKTVEWGDRRITMDDLSEIRKGRQEWEGRLTNRSLLCDTELS